MSWPTLSQGGFSLLYFSGWFRLLSKFSNSVKRKKLLERGQEGYDNNTKEGFDSEETEKMSDNGTGRNKYQEIIFKK